MLALTSASIINGSQTQGVIKDFLEKAAEPPLVHVKFELIVTTDDEPIADISIASQLSERCRVTINRRAEGPNRCREVASRPRS